jgi:hypothetical protein
MLEKDFGKSLLRATGTSATPGAGAARGARGELDHRAAAALRPARARLVRPLDLAAVQLRAQAREAEVGRYKRVLGTVRDRYLLELEPSVGELDRRLVVAFTVALDALPGPLDDHVPARPLRPDEQNGDRGRVARGRPRGDRAFVHGGRGVTLVRGLLAALIVVSGRAGGADCARATCPNGRGRSRRRRRSRRSISRGRPRPTGRRTAATTARRATRSLPRSRRANVRRLRRRWHIHLNGSGHRLAVRGEGTPLSTRGHVRRHRRERRLRDRRDDGTILWQYGAQLPRTHEQRCCGWVSRGLALGDGKVYLARLDGTLVASRSRRRRGLDGVERKPADGYTMTMAPLYYDGSSSSGVSGGEFRASGGLGDTHTTPRRPSAAGGFDTRSGARAARRGRRWPAGDEWQTGGAPVWNTPSVDPKARLLYFTTGNATRGRTAGAGDDLFTSSFVALTPRHRRVRVALTRSSTTTSGTTTARRTPFSSRRRSPARAARSSPSRARQAGSTSS